MNPQIENILIAPDKFKGSLSALEVCDAVGDAMVEIKSTYKTIKVPLADGGEGTFEILVDQSNGRTKTIPVQDPLHRPIQASYGLSNDGTTAFIEMARASGLQLLKESERNPLLTSTMGTGQLILDALNEGAETIIMGIGGSATNDAGIGLAQALGFRFFNKSKQPLKPIGKSLSEIEFIDETAVDARLRNTRFIVLCDVDNPLYGKQGAAYVYGPQKGATQEIVNELDSGLEHFAQVVKVAYSMNLDFPGAGAAGGLGAGTKLFLNASFRKGIDFVSELTGLEEKIKASDLVITGEGKVDDQTLSGKVVAHVVALANQYQKPIFIVCGQCTLSEDQLRKFGAIRIIALATQPSEVSLAIAQPIPLIKAKIKKAMMDMSIKE